jgi:hypothetical protein
MVLKSHVRHVLLKGGHRCFLRQSADPSGLLVVILAGHRWSVSAGGPAQIREILELAA